MSKYFLCPSCFEGHLYSTKEVVEVKPSNSDEIKTYPVYRCPECGTYFKRVSEKAIRFLEPNEIPE